MSTYLWLSLPFVLGAAALAVIGALASRRRRQHLLAVGLSILVLFALTAVFDSLMIAAGFFDYDDARTLGIRIGLAPLEDFGYPLVCALALPALWAILRRGKGHPDA